MSTKCEDDCQAKVDLWVRAGRVFPLPYGVRLPGFTSRHFSSYAEMNAWKEEQILRLATLPPEQWQIPYPVPETGNSSGGLLGVNPDEWRGNHERG